MSNGANNFYVSDQLSVQKVTFRNQYRMTVAGNLFIPKNIDRGTTHPVAQRKQAIAAAAEQRWAEFTGGETKYTSGSVHQLTAESGAIEREFYDFYRTPRGEFTPAGQSPLLTTHPTLSSNVKFMNFYPFNDIETISPRPMLFITGDVAHSREFSEDAYQRAAEPKELFVVRGAGHVDLYDRVNLIPFDKLTSFFTQHLAQRETAVVGSAAQ